MNEQIINYFEENYYQLSDTYRELLKKYDTESLIVKLNENIEFLNQGGIANV